MSEIWTSLVFGRIKNSVLKHLYKFSEALKSELVLYVFGQVTSVRIADILNITLCMYILVMQWNADNQKSKIWDQFGFQH